MLFTSGEDYFGMCFDHHGSGSEDQPLIQIKDPEAMTLGTWASCCQE